MMLVGWLGASLFLGLLGAVSVALVSPSRHAGNDDIEVLCREREWLRRRRRFEEADEIKTIKLKNI